MGTKRKSKGFTLIEVLVVVAIIALLVSILLPSLRRARQQARTVQCATRMRTCGQALFFYLQASKDYFPWSVTDNQGHGTAQWWEVLYRYIQKTSLTRYDGSKRVAAGLLPGQPTVWIDWYICPNDQVYHTTSQVPVSLNGEEFTASFLLSHCFNNRLRGKASVVKRPSSIVTFAEVGDDGSRMSGTWRLSGEGNTKPYDPNQDGNFQRRHLTGCNVVYFDGSIQFTKYKPADKQNYGLPPYPRCFDPTFDPKEDKVWTRPEPLP